MFILNLTSTNNSNNTNNELSLDNPVLFNDQKKDSSEDKYPGIDFQIGVGNVLGDEDLFDEILVMFYEDHSKDSEKIQLAINSEDQAACKHLVHTLKGVSCSVGAMKLFEVTKALDIAINLEEKTNYQRLYEPVATEILKVLGGIEAKLKDKL